MEMTKNDFRYHEVYDGEFLEVRRLDTPTKFWVVETKVVLINGSAEDAQSCKEGNHVAFKFPGKFIRAKNDSFHLLFNKLTGETYKWGTDTKEDPMWCPFGPELLDLEVTTICSGIRNKEGNCQVCSHCYKSNTCNGENMSFDTFKTVLDKVRATKTLTQVAFGADASLTSNPELFKMFDYCREVDIVPNVTCADITPETAEKLVAVCGAVAVSWYPTVNEDRCFDSIKYLTDAAAKAHKHMQINMHALLHKKSYAYFRKLTNQIKTDERLKGLNAVVVLSLKQKGRGTGFERATPEQFERLVDRLYRKHIRFGMDSCTCSKFMDYISKHPDKNINSAYCEPCESFMFSSYINCKGVFYPCSFMEGEGEWKEGIDVVNCNNFFNDVWKSKGGITWRDKARECITCKGHTNCPYYNV